MIARAPTVLALAALIGLSGLAQEPEQPVNPALEFLVPGEHHRHLAAFAGDWEVEVKFWLTPNAPAEESTATAEHKPVLGGRFLQISHQGQIEGQPFVGIGTLGYDNRKARYVETWMDNSNTQTIISRGACDGTGRVLILLAEYDHPLTNKRTSLRSVYRLLDANRYLREIYTQGPEGGLEWKALEMTYTRRSQGRPK